MGVAAAAILPVTVIAGVLVAVTRPLGSESVVLVVGVLAAAGVALTIVGLVGARERRR